MVYFVFNGIPVIVTEHLCFKVTLALPLLSNVILLLVDVVLPVELLYVSTVVLYVPLTGVVPSCSVRWINV